MTHSTFKPTEVCPQEIKQLCVLFHSGGLDVPVFCILQILSKTQITVTKI
jgi:hypothetical protein